MDLKQLGQLPSPFYRVTAKALIYDEQGRVLVGRTPAGWEMPGGGLEHGETIEDCLKREINEELGAEVVEVGNIAFIYKGRSIRGWMIVRIASPAKLKDYNFKFGDMQEARFVTKDEFLKLDFAADEGTVKDAADKIWP